MKKLVGSQETYIKELEGKIFEIEQNASAQPVSKTQHDWEEEKETLLDLVKKNQSMTEELESKMRLKEQEFKEMMGERERGMNTEKQYLESENKVMKQLQE